jgi:hypothetical protein
MAAFVTAIVAAVGTFLTSTTIGALLVRTALTALVSYALNRSLTKPQKQTGLDTGVRQQLAPATNHKIPVIYGTAYMGGAITEAKLVNSGGGNTYNSMTVVSTISERTGPMFSTGNASSYTFEECYRNADRIIFDTDGITVAKTVDADGNEDTSMAGLIRVYMYAGNSASASQIAPAATSVVGNVSPSLSPVAAYSIVPGWGVTDTMQDLIFAVIKTEYNRDKNVTAIGDYQFKITNSMTLGGDVIFDYATNTRYGAGIRLSECNTGESVANTISRLNLGTYAWIDLS